MQATTDWSHNLRVEVLGDDVVGHAGNVIPRIAGRQPGPDQRIVFGVVEAGGAP
jgi:hypothetical protein